MEFSDSFLPTANSVGMSSMVTYFFLIFAAYAFLGNVIFCWLGKSSVAPEHRTSRYFTAIIAAVAGISYMLIAHFYHEMLRELAHTTDPIKRDELLRTSYNAIGQLRYIDWSITTPLLLLKAVSMLKIQPNQAKNSIFWLLFADLFMVFTGYIGEQQLTANGHIMVGDKLIWGAISTLGYIIIPVILWNLWKRFKDTVQPEERTAYKWLALSTVTTWGVYPIGYILTTINGFNLNYIHISFSIFDVINKVGAGAVVYLAAKKILEKRVAEDATMNTHMVD
ncbi:bacteriorhodopsin [Mucilaginibacter robiniae]|uniref:Bacteriorhodopsin n=1 Tax=Mucilaginibacter robiniae TaxID=2728022 RepID=A0A7L5E652_9SPHI|nr:bacteriorhodopsin [Mucilaginibacter robiniae]QJD97799.1 bacteriorhodopsin [Mucilaginibacter robiniae]